MTPASRSTEQSSAHETLRRAQRILVLGSPGSGKTVLAATLGRHLGLELVRLDDHFWKAHRVRVPQDEWHAIVRQLARRPRWIMDGTYEASLELRLPAADAIVFIHDSRWTCLRRVIVRRLASRMRRTGAPAPGHALTAFFIRYVLRFPTVTQPAVMQLVAQYAGATPMIDLHGRAEVDALMRALGRSRRGAEPTAAALDVATPGPQAVGRRSGHA